MQDTAIHQAKHSFSTFLAQNPNQHCGVPAAGEGSGNPEPADHHGGPTARRTRGQEGGGSGGEVGIP
ncbi:hypothetical protein GCM10010435_16920 [Winogradskya consettensis]|uniref:Uncharacterized protein n=1 Tax=Winogradskya consettensis TaxID=113560 RepID=A0A919SUU3_9ACTN|nr:hypothetical protein Aco04nite_62130 [Actinoplanes consettensis]